MVTEVLTNYCDGREDLFAKESGMLVDQHLYRKAFQAYLRTGTPIEWSIKQERPTTHYIWRTREDEKVRPSHTTNDGQIFAWDDPPPTGHPGEGFGCRCSAEPYYPEATEHVTISLSGVLDSGAARGWQDFVRHYYRGNGRGVTVRETGHLQSIVARYLEMAEERIKKHIVTEARQNPNGSIADMFRNSYGMTGIVFSIGDTVIGGSFSGRAVEKAGVLAISGDLKFYLRDEFADPADIGETQRRLGVDDARDVEIIDLGETIFENLLRPLEDHGRGRLGLPPSGPQRLGVHTGEPYPITDEWSGRFEGQIITDPRKSLFG